MSKIFIILFFLIIISCVVPTFSQDIAADNSSISKNGQIIADSLNEKAFTLRRQNFDSSYYYANLALDISNSIEYNRGKAAAYKNMGTALWSKGNVVEAKEKYLNSLSIYEEIRDTNGIGRIWNNIGLIDITQNNFQDAIDNFEKSIFFNTIVEDTIMLATSYLNIGVSYYYLRQFEKAISYNQKSIGYSIAVKDSISLANNYSFLGASNIESKKLHEAELYLNLALEIYKKMNLNLDLAHNYNLFAVLNITKSNYQDAIKYAKMAVDISETIDSKANILEAYTNLSKSYKAIGDFEKAFEYLSKSNELYIELTNAEIQQKVADITLKYDYDKKVQQIENQRQIDLAKQQASIDFQNMIIAIISIVVFFLIVFSIFLINTIRTKKRKNLLLIEQKKNIDLQNNQLETMNQKLNKLNDTKDKFFSIIAHDLKNPIYSLNSMAQIVHSEYDSMDPSEKKEFVGHISRSSAHVHALLENLLTWSRSQRGQIKYSPTKGKIGDILKTTFEGTNMLAENKNIRLHVDLEDIEINTDINLLNTIVRNILSNAVKFTPENGEITVNGQTFERFYNLSIKDTGVGIPADKIDTLFTTGKNVSTPGTNDEKGTGLGLIISKEFAQQNGGDITVKSVLGEGTEFTITIPLK